VNNKLEQQGYRAGEPQERKLRRKRAEQKLTLPIQTNPYQSGVPKLKQQYKIKI